MNDFTDGTRVRATLAAFCSGLWPLDRHPVRGTVRGQARQPQMVRVVLDGQKTVHLYHIDVWEVDNDE